MNEIEAAQSLMLLNIPSTTMVRTFSNQPTNAERLLFTAFREKKSYQEIRSELAKNDNYKKSNEDVFIFPDEELYKKSITKKLKIPLKIDLQITDARGKPYELDSVH